MRDAERGSARKPEADAAGIDVGKAFVAIALSPAPIHDSPATPDARP